MGPKSFLSQLQLSFNFRKSSRGAIISLLFLRNAGQHTRDNTARKPETKSVDLSATHFILNNTNTTGDIVLQFVRSKCSVSALQMPFYL
jgi:hypothetical protein